MFEMVGASFTAVTVTLKPVAVDPPFPSLTVTVIVVEPDWSGRGLILIVRFVPLPRWEERRVGKGWGLDEAAERANADADVSASPTVNGNAAVAESSGID